MCRALVKKDMDEIGEQIQELKKALLEAGLSYDIWWELSNREARTEHLDDLNQYTIFFQSTIHAHFLTAVITLYRLFENRRDTINLPNLFQQVREKKLVAPEVENKLESAAEEIRENWTKICILRSNVFGHRSRKLSIEESYKRAGITPDQIKNLIKHMQDAMNIVSGEVLELEHSFELNPAEEVKRLLDDIATLRKSR